jgi:hypothetical protein
MASESQIAWTDTLSLMNHPPSQDDLNNLDGSFESAGTFPSQMEGLRRDILALETRQASATIALADFRVLLEELQRDRENCHGTLVESMDRIGTLEKGQKVVAASAHRALQATVAAHKLMQGTDLAEFASCPAIDSSSTTWSSQVTPRQAVEDLLVSSCGFHIQSQTPATAESALCSSEFERRWAAQFEDLQLQFDKLEAKIEARMEEAGEAISALQDLAKRQELRSSHVPRRSSSPIPSTTNGFGWDSAPKVLLDAGFGGIGAGVNTAAVARAAELRGRYVTLRQSM